MFPDFYVYHDSFFLTSRIYSEAISTSKAAASVTGPGIAEDETYISMRFCVSCHSVVSVVTLCLRHCKGLKLFILDSQSFFNYKCEKII